MTETLRSENELAAPKCNKKGNLLIYVILFAIGMTAWLVPKQSGFEEGLAAMQ